MLVISGHQFRMISEYVNDDFSLSVLAGSGGVTWQVLMNVLLLWPLSNYRGIRNLPGVYELISLHGLSVQAQIMVSLFDGLSTN